MTDSIRLMTFNVRVAVDRGADAWEHRRSKVASVVRVHRPDVVGLQEPREDQLADIRERLPGYDFVGVGRLDGETDGEFTPIGYRAERFELRDSGTFWLSETPESAGSVGWDAKFPRIVTWVRLREPDGEDFLVCNTHLDHEGARAREEGARVIRERLPKVAGDNPAAVVGDFNAVETEAPYAAVTDADAERPLSDARYEAEHGHHGPTDTFQGFTGYPEGKIDYVFVTDEIDVMTHAVLPDHWNGRYPSDHFPVLADLELPS
jgi:endonuclease/exonuclease/phosphatase family metal-dependent hydrolase